MPVMINVAVEAAKFAGVFLVEAHNAFAPPKRSGFSKMDAKARNFLH